MKITRDIPGHPGYVIDQHGTVTKIAGFNTVNARVLKTFVSGSGYERIRLVNPEGKPYSVGLHHLLGLAFINNPNPLIKTMINHKNGNPLDNRLINLEWVSNEENLQHARMMGLTGNAKPCEMRNCDTGEVTRFYSFRDMARATGFHRDSISLKLRQGETKVWPERRQYRWGHSDADWYIPNDIDYEIEKGGTSKSILLRNILTGEIEEMASQNALCEYLKLSAPAVSNRLENYKGIFQGFYQAKRLNDDSEWLTDEEWLDQYQNAGYRAILTIDHATDQPTIYTSTSECSKSNGVSMSNLNWWLKVPDKVQKDGKRYLYLTIQGLLHWKQWQDNSSN